MEKVYSNERWAKVNWRENLNNASHDLWKILKSDIEKFDNFDDWRKNYHDYIMKNYIQDNGDKIKLHIKEIFWWNKRLWYLVERLVSWEPESIWVSDTWFLYENHWWHEYWNIENDESYKKIYSEWVQLFKHNKDNIRAILPEGTVLVDVWCCEWDKALALLDWIWKKITYLPVDVDKWFIEKANWKIEKQKNITVEKDWIVKKWKITEPIQDINRDETKNYTYFFTWWSIWNYSDSDINQLLWITLKPKQWNLVLDYYKAPKTLWEITDILKSYDNEATKNWFKNWLNNLWFCPLYYFPGRNDLWKVVDELDEKYHIPKRWFWYNLLNIDDFLKFTVRYEFEIENNKYYVKLWSNNEMDVFKYVWTSVVKCDNTEIKKLEYMSQSKDFRGFSWKIVEWFEAIQNANMIKFVVDNIVSIKWDSESPQKLENEPILEKEQWYSEHLHSIVKWDASKIKKLGDMGQLKDFRDFSWKIEEWYVANVKWDSESSQKLEDEDVLDTWEWYSEYLHLLSKKNYLQDMLCQFWFRWKDWEFIPANFKEWEFYPIEISRRFSDEEMAEILKRNGRNIVKKFDKVGDNEDSKYLNVIVATVV